MTALMIGGEKAIERSLDSAEQGMPGCDNSELDRFSTTRRPNALGFFLAEG